MKYFSHVKIAFNKILDKAVGPLEAAVLGIIVISTLSYALAWQAPGQTPPAGNTDAPLNVGLDAQIKGGNLVVNALGITASGNALLVPNGNVGIGTTNPDAKLKAFNTGVGPISGLIYAHDSSSGTNPNPIFIVTNGGTGPSVIIQGQEGDAAPEKKFVILRNGNVGIGETNPSQKLDVAGYVRGQSGLCIGGDCRSTWADTSGPLVYHCPVFNEGCPGTCDNNLSLSATCVRGSSSDAFCRAWGGATEACTLVGRLVAP